MLITKVIPVLIFTLIFVLTCSAQRITKQNEPVISLFTLKEKMNKLQLLVSTKKDVMNVFGKNCYRACGYGDNWTIQIQYVEDYWVGVDNLTKETVTYKPQKEYLGKLLSIRLINFVDVLTDEYKTFTNLKCVNTTTYPGSVYLPGVSLIFDSEICSDKEGLEYFVIGERKISEGKTLKNVIGTIQFALPPEKQKEVIVYEKLKN